MTAEAGHKLAANVMLKNRTIVFGGLTLGCSSNTVWPLVLRKFGIALSVK